MKSCVDCRSRRYVGLRLGIEYDPDPPFDVGSPEKAAPDIKAALYQRLMTVFERE